jgi:hypothetical protein
MSGCQIKTDAGQDDVGLVTTLAVAFGTVLIQEGGDGFVEGFFVRERGGRCLIGLSKK